MEYHGDTASLFLCLCCCCSSVARERSEGARKGRRTNQELELHSMKQVGVLSRAS